MVDRPDSGAESPREDPNESEPLWIDRHLLPAIRTPALLPVVLVVIGHIVAFVAPALLFAARDRSAASLLAVVGLAVLSAECVRFEIRNRRRKTLTTIVLGTWVASVAAAFVSNHYGLL